MSPTGRSIIRLAKYVGIGAAILVAPAILVGQIAERGWLGCEFDRLQAALATDRKLDAQLQRASTRLNAHAQLIDALISGRATLAETAEQFGKICTGSSEFPLEAVQTVIGGTCDQERWCKCVLECVRMSLRDRADEAESVRARLHNEYETLALGWTRSLSPRLHE